MGGGGTKACLLRQGGARRAPPGATGQPSPAQAARIDTTHRAGTDRRAGQMPGSSPPARTALWQWAPLPVLEPSDLYIPRYFNLALTLRGLCSAVAIVPLEVGEPKPSVSVGSWACDS